MTVGVDFFFFLVGFESVAVRVESVAHCHSFIYVWEGLQLLKQPSPVSIAVKVWNEETDLLLQECLCCANWDVFIIAAWRENYTVYLDEYASVVTGYFSTCIYCHHHKVQ